MGGGVPSICLVYGGDMRALSYCISSPPQLVQYCGQGFNQLHLPPPALPLRLTLQLPIQIISPILHGHKCVLLIHAPLHSFSFSRPLSPALSSPLLYLPHPVLALTPFLRPSLTPVAPSLTSRALRQP